MKNDHYISLNGSLIKGSEAIVSPENRGMMYGDGCFETLKSYKSRFLKWDDHMDRLKGGLAYLDLEMPVKSDELKKEVLEVIEANHLVDDEAMVRIQFWREGGRGYKSTSKISSRMIQVSEYDRSTAALDLMTTQTRCIPSEALERRYKLSNGLNYIKAAQEANKSQKDDAVMLTVNGFVSETTIANLFWIKDDEIYTPSDECDILPGITRGIIIDLLNEMGHPINTGKYAPGPLYESTAVFLTNSLIEIQEVQMIDDIKFKTGHSTVENLRKAFQSYKMENLSK